MTDPHVKLKRAAAETAADLVEDGMVVGLGYGSTAIHAVRRISERIRLGELQDVCGVPVARSVEKIARELSIPLVEFKVHPVIDLTIDGADEVDPDLNLIKGGGGALLREKIVAQASSRLVIVVDESKLSSCLGSLYHLPVEVIPFSLGPSIQFLESLGGRPHVRTSDNGEPFVTDEGNWILDCDFGPIKQPLVLARRLEQKAGLVEHGLFLGMATEVIVAGEAGVRRMSRTR